MVRCRDRLSQRTKEEAEESRDFNDTLSTRANHTIVLALCPKSLGCGRRNLWVREKPQQPRSKGREQESLLSWLFLDLLVCLFVCLFVWFGWRVLHPGPETRVVDVHTTENHLGGGVVARARTESTGWSGLVWFGLVWFGLVWFGLVE